MRKILALLLACMLASGSCAAADGGNAMGAVRALVQPYYSDAIEVALNSPDLGRGFTDHKMAHAEMVAVKAVETGRAIVEAVQRGTLGGEAPAGCVAMSEEIDYAVLEAAALFHDTGMCGGYALNETVDENGLTVYETDENGRYIMYAEDNLNFAEVRVFHSLNSGLYVLLNRMELPSPCRRTARIRSMKSLEPGCSRGKRSIKGMV